MSKTKIEKAITVILGALMLIAIGYVFVLMFGGVFFFLDGLFNRLGANTPDQQIYSSTGTVETFNTVKVTNEAEITVTKMVGFQSYSKEDLITFVENDNLIRGIETDYFLKVILKQPDGIEYTAIYQTPDDIPEKSVQIVDHGFKNTEEIYFIEYREEYE